MGGQSPESLTAARIGLPRDSTFHPQDPEALLDGRSPQSRALAPSMSVDFLDLRAPAALRPHAVEVSHATLQHLRQLAIPGGNSFDNVITYLLAIYGAPKPEHATSSANDA